MYYKLRAKIKTKDGKEETVFNGNGLTEAMVIGAMEKLNPMYGGALLNVEVGQQSEDFIFSDNKKVGKWIHKNDDHNDWWVCSECGYGEEGEVKENEVTPFCPYCGAEMKEIEG